ncbi:MAG: 30S ribosomal protein S13 [Bdellovibrionales bacterium]|jgi:small subunit ribosomal protein S13|nr:30S ribosomal protein S13 [Bdellovibrionales bacterium]MBK9041517.1 30S ribosomal protein S13 [Bdellovibrionales bacterium]
MARIAGVDLPRGKRLEVALTYVYGIGRVRAAKIMEKSGFDIKLRTDDLTDEHLAKLRSIMDSSFKVEGDLRREVGMSIKRLMDLGCYRGIRHKKGLPVRGQSTRQNARTRKGPKKTVANKKKIV